MSGFSVNQIIELAREIERGSIVFYENAARIMQHENTIHLVNELAKEEKWHLLQLDNLLQHPDQGSEPGEGLSVELEMPAPDLLEFTIDPGATVEEILTLAVEREKKTEAFYSAFLRFQGIDGRVRQIFELLKNQEMAHAQRLGSILSRDSN